MKNWKVKLVFLVAGLVAFGAAANITRNVLTGLTSIETGKDETLPGLVNIYGGVSGQHPKLRFHGGTDTSPTYGEYWEFTVSNQYLTMGDNVNGVIARFDMNAGVFNIPTTGSLTLGNTGIETATWATSSGNIWSAGNIQADGVIDGLTLEAGGADALTPDTSGDDIKIEGTGHTGMTILSGTSSLSSIYFGDSGNVTVGRVAYNNNGNTMSFYAGALEAMKIDGTQTLDAVTIEAGDADAITAHSQTDDLKIENAAHAGLSIFAGTGALAGIYFGDSGSNVIGRIFYHNSGDYMSFYANGAEAIRLDSSQTLVTYGDLDPSSDGGSTLGADALRFADGFFDALTATALTADSLDLGTTLKFDTAPIYTIASDDDITPAHSHIIAAAFSGTADNLDELTGGTLGHTLFLRADSGDTITILHDSGVSTGNILCDGGTNITMNASDLVLCFHNGSEWVALKLIDA